MKSPKQEAAYFYNELIAFEDLIRLQERYWIEELERYEQSLNSDDESIAYRFNYRSDLLADLEDKYPQYQRRSYLIMLVAMFEDFLNQFAFCVQDHCSISSKFAAFPGKGTEKVKKYLSKETVLKFPSQTLEWNNIWKAQQIRNVIVHAAGFLDPIKHKGQAKIVHDDPFLSTENYARVRLILYRQYLPAVIENMKSFSNKLIESVAELSSNLAQAAQ